MKKTNLFGALAAVSVAFLLFALYRRKFRWILLFLNVLVAAGIKLRDERDLNQIRSLTDQLD